MKIINGNEYSKLSHYVEDPKFNKKIDKNVINNNGIIFVNSKRLDNVFNIIKNSNKNYILISHHFDLTIDKNVFMKAPNCIKRWFALNNTYRHPKLVNIPLGIENEHPGNRKPPVDYKWLKENLSRLYNKEKDESTLYCNWTNRNYRNPIVNILKNNGLKIKKESGLNQKDYIETLASYKYIVCPPGTGLDTFRLWMALYVGSIPIEIDYNIHRNLNLPIIKLNKWEEISPEVLNKFDEKKYSHYWLDMKNWENLIKNEYKKL